MSVRQKQEMASLSYHFAKPMKCEKAIEGKNKMHNKTIYDKKLSLSTFIGSLVKTICTAKKKQV